jgi:hydroxymethylpyrimidine/phosphomethylpyrimidine kinase
MAAVTSHTAQSTVGVTAVHHVPAAMVAAQLDTLAADVRIDAVKIGMLGGAGVATAVADALERHRWPHVVLDTVMVAKSGHRLLDADAVAVVRDRLVPLADLVTPNLPEAAVLAGAEAEAADEAQMERQAKELVALGARRVLLKGGHLVGSDESVDLLVDGGRTTRLTARRVATANDHGTGCTLSSAIAALRPQRDGWLEAVTDAKAYLTAALAATPRPDVGHGHGPVHHFWALWTPAVNSPGVG